MDYSYTRKYIINLKHNDYVEFEYKIKGVVYKLPKIKLVVDKNAWSLNKYNVQEIKAKEKKIIGLFNKITDKNYDSISIQFIELMNDYKDHFKDLVPKLYETILKLLCYKDCYINLFILYQNNNLIDIIIKNCLLEFDYMIGNKKDTHEYKSLLEEPETIKKRYQLNNLLFMCDLYIHNKLELDIIFNNLLDNNNINYVCIIITKIYKQLKKQNINLYSNTIIKIKQWSKDKQYPPKLRFQCMDVLDKML